MGQKENNKKLCLQCARILYPDVDFDDMGFYLADRIKCDRCGDLVGVYTLDEFNQLKKEEYD